MLRANLATRPFYNERLVHLMLGFGAVLVGALVVFNVARVVTLSTQYAELTSVAGREEAAARRLEREAAAIRQRIQTEALKGLTAAARQANALIDQRTFSWTQLFNRIETTLPPDVMLAAVRPYVEQGVSFVQMVVIGRRVESIEQFMNSLEETGAFQDLLARQEEKTDDGLYQATLRGRYVTTAAPGPPRERSAKGVSSSE